MFTVEQRDALRDRVLRLAEEDDRVVAAAVVGSLAVDGGGDRFSDLDLTFGIADRVPVTGVLDDWTTRLVDELDAVTLADLERGLTIYRVFLLPGALQLDLSMTPAAQFRPYGPRLRFVFGQAAADEPGPIGRRGACSLIRRRSRGHFRLGRHLRAAHARVHRAPACLASRALRGGRT
jgi:predicted nucleotidyltransferase